VKESLLILLAAFGFGFIFAAGQDTYRWLMRRLRKKASPEQTLIVTVDNAQAMEALDAMKAKLEDIQRLAGGLA
jgi:hypothetical protein